MTALAQPSDLPPGVGNGQVYLGHAPGGWLQATWAMNNAQSEVCYIVFPWRCEWDSLTWGMGPGGFLQTEHIGVWKIEMRAAVD